MTYNLITKSEYDLFNSLCSLEGLINVAKERGLDALCISDPNMYGAYKFYNLCLKQNIKPILGLEVKIQEIDGLDLYLYAKGYQGYLNLIKIASIQNSNTKHDVSINDLRNDASDLLVIMNYHNMELFKKDTILTMLHDLYPDLYIGITPKTIDYLDYLNKYNHYNLEFVAIHETRYLGTSDELAYKTLNAIKQNVAIDDIKINEDYHFFTEAEYLESFKKYPHLLNNTSLIVAKCHLTIPKQHNILPKYDETIDSFNYLKAICLKGLEKRFKDNNLIFKNETDNPYLVRLEKELAVIKKLKFADYFLIVWDYVKYAHNENIMIGPGRGSAASSLVSYLLGITDVDPLKYGLLFERFLNEERLTMPDIDMDFPDLLREKVINYVVNRYGKNRVVHIVTFSTFLAKSTLKDVAKALNLSSIKLEEVLKCFKDSKDQISEVYHNDANLQKLCSEYKDILNLIEISLRINNLPRAISTHAAGIIIADKDIKNYTPIDCLKEGLYQSQYDAHDLEDLGLLKMDFLGLRNLTIIDRMLKSIQNDYSNLDPIIPKDYNDHLTFQLLNNADTLGIFQLESSGMKQMLKKIGINQFEDISQALALYRPGPLSMIDTYVKRKKGLEPITYLDKRLEDILKPTYGIILYQEQIMLLARKVAGYSLKEADILRRAISKKQKDVMEQERHKFVLAAIQNGYLENIARAIYEYIYKFADYGFNRAHSVSYSMITYQMAYLKAHYPAYFYAVLLDDLIGSSNLDEILIELKNKRINLLPPHINYSESSYKATKNSLLMPLSLIKGVGKNYSDLIITERQNGVFTSFENFIQRTHHMIPLDIYHNLIYSNALDVFQISKKAMIENIADIIKRSKYSFVSNVSKINYALEEYGYGYLLNKEKEVLNMNLKYDYIKQYQKLYNQKYVVHIKDLSMGKVQTLGKITKLRTINTKTNKKMAFFTLVDNESSIDVVIFPNQINLIKDLKEDMVIIVQGTINNRDKDNKKEIILDNYRQV